ncbi:MAG: tetratricopeptide repeat protein [Bacteroidetes bacterium]|nr:tetratricopeptide repeat protein [Bacteroidota bacterium]MBV6460139.1 hypothetical protein [Flavobacteriales bacterium]WKZ74010.1 MAG: tetratricopeptide repeat protein [Vicingaceae bacterium]MCL4817415.1 tetratricopeptide repeat protein [Flavobacteriales bacterium]NOG96046.1 tetratricopeptide repeat protein [Bacteroidota bacterium]
MLKKAIAICSVVALSTGVFAQKAKVVSAYNYLNAYERGKKCSELKNGKEAIDAASENDQTRSEAKTWYYRGNIYFAISEDKNCKSLDSDALNKAFDSYSKALKYNIQDPAYHNLDIENNQEDAVKFFQALMNKNTKMDDPAYTADIIGVRFPIMSNRFLNQGVEQYQGKDFEKSYESFGKSVALAQMGGRIDTLGIYYAAISAEKSNKKKEAKELYIVLTTLKYHGDNDGPKIYAYLSQLYKEEGDKEKANEIIKQGRVRYPNDKGLIIEELDYYLQSGKNQEALTNLNLAIEKDPNNHLLHYAQGTILDKMGENDKAEASYKKAIELSPEYFDANYNLGAMYFNKGVEWNNKANDLPLNEKKKYQEYSKNAEDQFKNALPYLEKAHEINPADVDVAKPLLKIYQMTNATDKYKALKEKIGG